MQSIHVHSYKINIYCHAVVMKQPVNFLTTANRPFCSGLGPNVINKQFMIINGKVPKQPQCQWAPRQELLWGSLQYQCGPIGCDEKNISSCTCTTMSPKCFLKCSYQIDYVATCMYTGKQSLKYGTIVFTNFTTYWVQQELYFDKINATTFWIITHVCQHSHIPKQIRNRTISKLVVD